MSAKSFQYLWMSRKYLPIMFVELRILYRLLLSATTLYVDEKVSDTSEGEKSVVPESF